MSEFMVEVSFEVHGKMDHNKLSDEIEAMITEQIEDAGGNRADYKIVRSEDLRSERYIYTAVPK